jgi:ankyrin repeat protein
VRFVTAETHNRYCSIADSTSHVTLFVDPQEEFIATLDPSSSGTYNTQVYASLATSIFHGHHSVAEVLLTKTSLPINFQGQTGNTALMFAAQWGNLAVVQYLLDSGADVTLKNASGETALTLALKNGQRQVAVLLRSFGGV